MKAQPWKVIVLVTLLSTLVLGEGYDIGVINGVMVILKKEWGLTTWEMSMAVTAVPFFVMLSAVGGGVLADCLGRRGALLIACVNLALGPVLMFNATAYWMLVAGRSVAGMGIGLGMVTSSMYISEIAPTHLRGQLSENAFQLVSKTPYPWDFPHTCEYKVPQNTSNSGRRRYSVYATPPAPP